MQPDTDHKRKREFPESISDRPDGWLLHEWKKGDERAAKVLFDRYAVRLVALVASRLNHRYQARVDPGDVVQSAMGSFFAAAKHSRIQVSESVSLWRLLATFARRKMARTIERQSASKRGGDRDQVSLDRVTSQTISLDVGDADANEFIRNLRADLPEDLFLVVEGVLAGQTQREVAESLRIDERTVRRRLARVRELLAASRANPEATVHAASSPPNLPRVNYNEFVLGKLIDSGGFGKVYRARRQADGQTVAVKFLRKAFWQNEDARESFLREINAASQIEHPGVLRYLGYGESPHGGPYVLSQWINGRPMQAFRNPNEPQFTAWLKQICQAIQAVHHAGLVHGDLTPANILIDQQDRVTITDFGFSQAFRGEPATILGGTLGFAAPEQIDPAFGNLGPHTDIYAIGGLIHWFLYRQPPNAASSIANTVMKTIANSRTDGSDASPINANLPTILQRSLPSSPADRSITIEEILGLLSTFVNDAPANNS